MNLTHTSIKKQGAGPNRSSKWDVVFVMFCLWTFVLLCRPQDIFPFLSVLRPALSTGLLTLGMVVVHMKKISGPPFSQEKQIRYYIFLLLIMIAGIPTSLYARLSFMAIFTEYINVILFFFIFYKVVNSVERLSLVVFLSCLGNGLYSAYAVKAGHMEYGRLIFGDMFDPNDLAFFAVSFLPLNLIFISREHPLWMRLACLGCIGAGILLILLTGSRGGLLAFGIAVLLLLVRKTLTVSPSLKGLLVAMCLVFVSFSAINMERYLTMFSIEEDYNVQAETGRLAIWKIGIKAMFANPLTGVGVGCFSNAVGMDREARGIESARWQTAHNSAVQIGTETGIIGLTLFLLLSLNVLRIFNRVKQIATSRMLVRISEMVYVGFVGLFTAGMFLSQAYSFYWAFFIVLSAVASQLLVQEQARQARSG